MNILKNNFRISFFLTFFSILIIFLVQSTIGGFGFNFDYSVSRYVGLTAVSASIFLLCNIANICLLFPALKSVKRSLNLNIVWYIISIIMLVALLSLSICPVGLHDEVWGEFGTISVIHRISAGTMFVLAIILSTLTLSKLKRHLPIFLLFIAFIAYGAVFVLGFRSNAPIVTDNMLFLESEFLLWFLFNFSILPEN